VLFLLDGGEGSVRTAGFFWLTAATGERAGREGVYVCWVQQFSPAGQPGQPPGCAATAGAGGGRRDKGCHCGRAGAAHRQEPQPRKGLAVFRLPPETGYGENTAGPRGGPGGMADSISLRVGVAMQAGKRHVDASEVGAVQEQGRSPRRNIGHAADAVPAGRRKGLAGARGGRCRAGQTSLRDVGCPAKRSAWRGRGSGMSCVLCYRWPSAGRAEQVACRK